MTDEILQILKSRKYEQDGIIPLKLLCLQIIAKFFVSVSTAQAIEPQLKVDDRTSRLVARTEKILIDALTRDFPGIDKLAQTLHTSPTKLQNAFKEVHHNSIYQYYQEKQMILALQLLKSTPTSLKEIALIFGYQNPSKFSAAFKKYHQVLPSEV